MTAIATPTAVAPALPDSRASLRLVTWLASSWALLLVVGIFMVRDPNALAANNRVSVARSAFMAANVSSLNGFACDFARPDDFSAPVRAVFVLQTLSGMLLSLVGGGVLLSRLLGRPHSDGRLTAVALGMMVLSFAAGAACGFGNPLSGGFQSLCALSCAGVVFGDVPRPGLAFSLVIVPLSLLGSVGVVVVQDVVDWLRRRGPVSAFSRNVLTLTAVVYLACMAAMLILDPPTAGGAAAKLVGHDQLFWSARAWGAPVSFASSWHGDFAWAVLAVVLVGSGSAGAGAAIGLGWLFTATGKLRTVATNALTAQAVLAAATLATLAFVEPTLSPVRRALLVASATMNVGLSHEPISQTGTSLLALAACMVLAKLLPLAVFAIALRRPASPAKDLT